MNRNNFFKTMLVAAMFAPIAISAQSDTTRIQCNGITKKNVQCKNIIVMKMGLPLCYLHNPKYVKPVNVESTVCSGTKKDGNACSLRTKHVSGFCHHHRSQITN